MSWLVQPRLVNGPFDDPGVFLDFRFGRRAILFDLGDLGPLSARELMRVSHVCVSHAHMDHFAGFDRLLRVCLHRPGRLVLVGPPGFADKVRHRLAAYTWNLLGEDSADFCLSVQEFEGERLASAAEFRARSGFARQEAPVPLLPKGCVLEEEEFVIEAATLDHGIPCLAFSLRERMRVNVLRGGLERLGLPVGPWLNEAKRLVKSGAPDDTEIAVPGRPPVHLGALRSDALRTGPGQVVAYVTDAVFNAANARAIIRLARGADQFFIEAAFLESDSEIAATKLHLTAAQAGRLAREAGARHLVPFHFSPRYLHSPEALGLEAEAAFKGAGS